MTQGPTGQAKEERFHFAPGLGVRCGSDLIIFGF